MSEITCECSDEYGPCERHGETLVVREGASQRTADDLTLVLIDDLLACGAELSAMGRFTLDELTAAAERDRDPVSGCMWFADSDVADAARDLAWQLENYVADLWVIHEDGYRIVRPSDDCPL